jgi:tetratricopeptide (TPR) repeat protein
VSQRPDIDSLLDAAIVSHEARDLDHAENLYQEVLRAQPDNAEACSLLGLIQQDRGRPEESIVLISRAVEIDPDFADAHANLARGLNLLGKPDRAAEAARKAIELDPALGEGWLQLGHAQLELGQDQEALTALAKAAVHFPEASEIYAGTGFAAQRLGRHADALKAWRKVLELQPERVDALVNLGAAHIQMNELDDALALHRRAAALAPEDATALGALAATFHRRYEPAELVPACRAALAIAPEQAEILTMLATGLLWLGHFDEAVENCEAALASRPDYVPAAQLRAILRPDTVDTATIERFREQLRDPNLSLQDRASAGFSIANALDKAGDFDAAFDMYAAANGVYRSAALVSGSEFKLEEFTAYVDWACSKFSPSYFAAERASGHPSLLPVFIVGMPRSGTSLVEQIAASHPGVFGAGERKDIAAILKRMSRGPDNAPVQHWNHEQALHEAGSYVARLESLAGGAVRVIDKMPDNIKVLGQIRLLFPNARIIICRRDLRDVCVSCFTTHFGGGINWSWDIEDCAKQAVETERLLDFWRAVLPGPVMEISYEALVANMETESRRLIAFLGLEWDPACLAFHETQRPVTTASALQVRRPVYSSSIGKWRRYEAHLGPMARLLDGHISDQAISWRWDTPEGEASRRATAAMATGNLASAIQVLRRETSRLPNEHDLHVRLGLALGQNGDLEEAIAVWRRALVMQPERAHSLANLGLLLIKTGRAGESVELLRRAIALRPGENEYHRALALALWELKDVKGAHDAYLNACALAPDDMDSLLSLGHCAASLGQFEQAASHYRRILEREPSNTEARFSLLAVGKIGEPGDISGLRSVLADPGKLEDDRIWAGFALGKALDSAADYDGAFAAYHVANELSRDRGARQGKRFDAAASAGLVDRLIEAFSRNAFQAAAGWGDSSDLPVFVVGVPRSGTSLVEQILASHPLVFGAGERSDIVPAVRAVEQGGSPDFPSGWNPVVVKREATEEVRRLRALGGAATRVIDKLPGNVHWLGHLRIMLPRARVIVCRRDPRDIGLSCYFNNFASGHEWSNDLGDIATQIDETDRIMAHWRAVLPGPVMEIQYEDLVANIEGQSRRMVEFLGLPWDPACLEFHRTERAVTTASVWQVRQKLYDSSIGRWRHYERHLGPLLILERAWDDRTPVR